MISRPNINKIINKDDYIMYHAFTNDNFFLSLLEKIGLYKPLDKSLSINIYKNGNIEYSYKLINNDVFYVVDHFQNHYMLKPVITSDKNDDRTYHKYLTVDDKINFTILTKKDLRQKKLSKLLSI